MAKVTNQFQERLALQSQFSDIARIPVWIESLSSRYAIPANLEYVMNLCLEEAITNVIRHGYCGEANRSVVVQFAAPVEGHFIFTVEDEAPRYNPLDGPELPSLNPSEAIRVGGQGIRFLREFSDSLEYVPTDFGNRLVISFASTGPANRKD